MEVAVATGCTGMNKKGGGPGGCEHYRCSTLTDRQLVKVKSQVLHSTVGNVHKSVVSNLCQIYLSFLELKSHVSSVQIHHN